MSTTTSSTTALPFQPSSMTSAQLAAVSFLARYAGTTHSLYRAQLGRWFAWCETNGSDPLMGYNERTSSSTSACLGTPA